MSSTLSPERLVEQPVLMCRYVKLVSAWTVISSGLALLVPSDPSQAWFVVMMVSPVVALPALLLLVYRLLPAAADNDALAGLHHPHRPARRAPRHALSVYRCWRTARRGRGMKQADGWWPVAGSEARIQRAVRAEADGYSTPRTYRQGSAPAAASADRLGAA